MDKEFVNEVNKIIFDIIWKGKDRMKHCVLVGDIEDGGLKAPHLDSVKSSRVKTVVAKKFFFFIP